MGYSGFDVSKMLDYIISVCKKKGWDTNRLAIIQLLNMASSELESHAELSIFTDDITTVADQVNYDLHADMNFVHEAFMVETGEDGYKPLKRATYKQIQASIAEADADDVVEP